jgi:ribosomal protein S10
MSADQCQVENGQVATAPVAVPFASEFVTITKQEYVELLSKGNFYKSQHERAMKRSKYNEDRYRRLLRLMKEQAAQREAALCTELDKINSRFAHFKSRFLALRS